MKRLLPSIQTRRSASHPIPVFFRTFAVYTEPNIRPEPSGSFAFHFGEFL